jgi:hypothetical protein
MKRFVDCFFVYTNQDASQNFVDQLLTSPHVNNITVLCTSLVQLNHCEKIVVDEYSSCSTIRQIAKLVRSEFAMLALGETPVQIGHGAIERLVQVAEYTEAPMIYCDYLEFQDEKFNPHPLIDYQLGSLHDEFNFGPVRFYRAEVLKAFRYEDYEMLKYAGGYALRLRASRMGQMVHIPEYLFTEVHSNENLSTEASPEELRTIARERQVEMEQVCKSHLRDIGALLLAPFPETILAEPFEYEASVIIVARNSVMTIRDAIVSVLIQKTNFQFNLIVVDNHSSDGTSEIINEYAVQRKLIRIVPEANDLENGGCWNVALFHPLCGKFAVQLDSDDLYLDENTLQIIVDKFYEENCAMVVGSYRSTDFNLAEIPPGVVDHRDWTDDNGPNNALRVSHLGAPSAFYTPVIREIRVPNVNFGKDYALALAISGKYKIGRIYQPVYLCRQWEENTDAMIDIATQNARNLYKDRIRTFEIHSRIRRNKLVDPDRLWTEDEG